LQNRHNIMKNLDLPITAILVNNKETIYNNRKSFSKG
ncbi:hypothetical protein PMLGA01_040015600, partial [Plasmodium malariae]